MAIQMILRDPIFVEHESSRISCADVQVILNAAVFFTSGVYQPQEFPAEFVFFTWLGLDLSNNCEEFAHIWK